MSVTILIRGGTAAEWAAADPVLHAREMGLETDTQKFKFGDGVTAWSGLPYAGATGSGTVTDVTATAPLASSGGATPDISITLPADASKYLDGTGNFTTPAGGGTVTDVTASAPLASSGGTTPDISASDFDGTNSGLVPAGPADATKYLDGSGNFTVPAGSGGTVTDVTATAPVTSSGGATPDIAVPVFVASGASHAAGLVPDPGASGGTTKFLREDATFQVPPGGATPGMVQLAQAIGTGASATLTFSSIPAGYTNLEIRLICRDTKSALTQLLHIKINSDGTAANYTNDVAIGGTGTGAIINTTAAATTSGGFVAQFPAATAAASQMSSAIVTLNDYNGSHFKKIAVRADDWTDVGGTLTERLIFGTFTWKNTAAITQIDLISDGTAFTTTTVATLYGLL